MAEHQHRITVQQDKAGGYVVHLIKFYLNSKLTLIIFRFVFVSSEQSHETADSALADSDVAITGMTDPLIQAAKKNLAIAARDKRNKEPDIREAFQKVLKDQQKHFVVRRQCQTAIDELNSSLSNIDVKKIERLDTRMAKYATDATRTEKLNDNQPYESKSDPDGRLKRVDVAECVHICDDFLAELGRGGFGVVYLTKPTKIQPSVVMKVASALQRYSSAHEYTHLSKFKFCPYFVSVMTGSLKDWLLGPALLECFSMKYEPDLCSLKSRRNTLTGNFSDPATTQFYTVALADIALNLPYMHAAKLIHGDLKVND